MTPFPTEENPYLGIWPEDEPKPTRLVVFCKGPVILPGNIMALAEDEPMPAVPGMTGYDVTALVHYEGCQAYLGCLKLKLPLFPKP